MFTILIIIPLVFFLTSCDDTSDDDVDTFPVEFSEIPAGPFTYGEYATEMTIDYSYDIMIHEVTNNQYKEFLQELVDQGSIYFQTVENEQYVYGYFNGYGVEGDVPYLRISGENCLINWNGQQFFVNRNFVNHPANYVTWYGAQAFAEYYGWRLPTEMEWEKAARGNTGRAYPWGDEAPDCDMANFIGCNGSAIRVGETLGASIYDVYDLSGNVWEWCEDEYLFDIYSSRVLKGGGWNSIIEYLKTWQFDYRFRTDAENDIGFRCVRTE